MKIKCTIAVDNQSAELDLISAVAMHLDIDAGINARTARALVVEVERDLVGAGRGEDPIELRPFSLISEPATKATVTVTFIDTTRNAPFGSFSGVGTVSGGSVHSLGGHVAQLVTFGLKDKLLYRLSTGEETTALSIR